MVRNDNSRDGFGQVIPQRPVGYGHGDPQGTRRKRGQKIMQHLLCATDHCFGMDYQEVHELRRPEPRPVSYRGAGDLSPSTTLPPRAPRARPASSPETTGSPARRGGKTKAASIMNDSSRLSRQVVA